MFRAFACLALAACGAAPPPAPLLHPSPQPDLAEHHVVEEVAHGGGVVVADDLGAPQPAYVKLKLGHYRNVDRGISVTIDLTDASRIPRAKLRFDHELHVIELAGQPGPRGRTDYLRGDGRVGLHAWDDGRRVVYIFDPDTLTSSGPIELERDGDADAL